MFRNGHYVICNDRSFCYVLLQNYIQNQQEHHSCRATEGTDAERPPVDSERYTCQRTQHVDCKQRGNALQNAH